MRKKIFNGAALFLCVLFALTFGGCRRGGEELYSLPEGNAAWNTAVGEDSGLNETQEAEMPLGTKASFEAETSPGGGRLIYVHVCGAVASPGVVELREGSRAQAAVEAAGGFAEDADVSFVNLAAPVEDGEQLYIPTKEEAAEKRVSEKEEESGLIDLNTADKELLCTLPGIGASRADDIIAYRQKTGGFADPEELMQVPGIKEATYEKLKSLVTAGKP